MVQELEVVHEQEVLGKGFKIYGGQDSPLFLARDVADWIEHNKPAEMIRNIDEDEKLMAIVSHSGQNREMWFLTEDGMYEVLMQSRKPIAKQFKKKVKEILKILRKSGGYVSNSDLLVNTYFGSLANEQKLIVKSLFDNIEQQQKEKELLRTENLILEQQVKEYEPKVTYYDQILQSKSLLTITQIAKDYGLSGQELNKTLHKEKVQFKQSGQWLLYASHQDKGYTKSDTQRFLRSDGEEGTKLHTKWTQKGRLFIHSVLERKGILAIMDKEDHRSHA